MTPMVSGFCANANGLAPSADRAASDFSVSRRLNCWLMEISSVGRVGKAGSEGSGGGHQQAHVRRHHAPALRRAHPGLALPAGAVAADAAELDVGGGDIAPEGGDHGLEHVTLQALCRAASTEAGDGVEAVQVLVDAVAQRV